MLTVIATVVLSVCIVAAIGYLFFRLKTPYYRVDRARMVRVLEMVLTGQATDNNWYMTFGMTIRHSPALECIRQQCVDVEEHYYIGEQQPPYLFSLQGREQLRVILDELKQLNDS
ncbi:hypothetical protein ACVBE9_09845 [Eionea flava]